MINSTESTEIDRFAEKGYLGPIPVLTNQECRRFWKATRHAVYDRRLDWIKSLATTSRPLYELAIHPKIVDIVAQLLGDNVMLWGASIESRKPQAIHPWHSDIESALYPQSTVSVWIGIEFVTRESSLMFVPYSHKFGLTFQEERNQRSMDRNDVSKSDVDAWSVERDGRSGVIVPNMSNGDALFFDGQLWHGSQNTSARKRHAILLQYSTPSTEIRIPDLSSLDWPFTFLDQPRPPCIMISGSSSGADNRYVSPPSASSDGRGAQFSSEVHLLSLPLAYDEASVWTPHYLFNGSTGNNAAISCHVSSLAPGKTPHPPHTHDLEEILLMLDGEADLLLPDLAESGKEHRVRLKPGQFVYYPANFAHTLRTVSKEPANYLMFKWFTKHVKHGTALRYGQFEAVDRTPTDDILEGFQVRLLFEGPTLCLRKLHAHTTTLTPGAGYDAHVDAHDVAIFVFAGEIETQGATYGPNSLVYFAAGEPHNIHNPKDDIARYLVFEFHGHYGSLAAIYRNGFHILLKRITGFLKKIMSLSRWKRKLKSMIASYR